MSSVHRGLCSVPALEGGLASTPGRGRQTDAGHVSRVAAVGPEKHAVSTQHTVGCH